jgi:hypothetical protein
MGWFRHLPVTSELDTTANFEQLQPVIEDLVAVVPEGKKQLVVGGLAVVEWTVKGNESASTTVVTGLGVIVGAVGGYIGSPQVVGNISGITGGKIKLTARQITGEVAAGTKETVGWLALGYA